MKAKINPSLAALVVPTRGLHVDPRNARKHAPTNLARIKRSLKAFGQQKAIVTTRCRCSTLKGAHEVAVAGNGTLFVAVAMGWKEIARTLIDDAKLARAYGIADNRSGEGAGWHREQLEETLRELDQLDGFDVSDVGFDAELSMPEPRRAGRAIYMVVVEVDTEREQAALFEEIEKRGLRCRLRTA